MTIGVTLFIGCTGLALTRAGLGWPFGRTIAVVVPGASYQLLTTWPATVALTWVAALIIVVAVIEETTSRP